MTLHPRFLAGVVAIGLAVTACSSSSTNGTPATQPSTPPTTQATTTSAPPPTTSSSTVSFPSTPPATSAPATGSAPSQDKLKAIVVQQSDVPSGYSGSPSDSSSDDDSSQQQIVQCVGGSGVNASDKIDEEHSDDFVKNPQTVSSDATSYSSQAAVDALVSVITNPKAQDCFNQLLKQQVEASGGSVTSANITITPGRNGGPSNVVALLQGRVDVTASGEKLTLNVIEGFIEGKQLLATVSVEAINAAADVNLFKQVGLAVANRAAAA
jgi:hypothetical protein